MSYGREFPPKPIGGLVDGQPVPNWPVHPAGVRLANIETRVVEFPYVQDFPRHGDPARFAREYIPTLQSWSENTFAAALAGATLGKDASPFAGTSGGPPKTGQFFIAISTECFSGGEFTSRIQALTKAISSQPNARLPGSRRQAQRSTHHSDGINVDEGLLAKIEAFVRS